MNVVLFEPEIPPNTGNVARLCAAAGARLHLVEPLGFRLNDRELRRAGMDYWRHVEWKRWTFLDDLLAAAGPGARFWYVTRHAPRPYTEPRYAEDDWLVFGKESRGLPAVLLEANPDRTVAIPMFNPEARSLNLATAVGIVLYEALRQVRGF